MLKKIGNEAGKPTVVGSLVGLGVGGASFFAAMKAAQKISFLQTRWYATPAALAVAGHIAKKWSNPTGQAMVGAAGALAAFSYYVQSQTPTTQPAPAASGYDQAGRFIDAGAVQRRMLPNTTPDARPRMRSEAGALQG